MIAALSIQQQIAEAFAAACPDLATAGVSILCEDALAKVGCVGIVSTPQFAPAGDSVRTMDCTAALEFYETAANRQRADAVTALSCALYAAQNTPTNYGFTNLAQESLGEGILRARVDLALTISINTNN